MVTIENMHGIPYSFAAHGMKWQTILHKSVLIYLCYLLHKASNYWFGSPQFSLVRALNAKRHFQANARA